MKLGSPTELVELYASAHEIFNPSTAHSKTEYMYAIMAAADVIRACSDIDPSDILVDVTRKDSGLKMILKSGDQLTPESQLIIASGLLRHGIAGVSKNKTSGKGKAATEVDLWDFVHTAMTAEKIKMTKKEALALTMTEFVRLIERAYPEEKKEEDISLDDYKAARDRLKRIRKLEGANDGN